MANRIILASAGTGKTTFIIKEASLLKKVLIISFTNNTCEDIKKKLKNVDVMTLHSFLFLNINENCEIIEDVSLLIKIFIEKYPNLKNLNIFQIINIYNKASLSDFTPDFSSLDEKETIINEDLLKMFLEIEEEKKKTNLLTFNDIIKKFKSQINSYYYKISENYDHIFIDESQDFSIYQLSIIEDLIDNIFSLPNKSFTIVGDVKQSIYSFQGASIVDYNNFLNRLINKYQIDIENKNKTYRFGGEILDFVNKIYPHHSSDNKDGFFIEKKIDKKDVVSFLKENIKDENVMILYERQSKLIEKIQDSLYDLGVKLKIFVEENIIFQALEDICSIYFNRDSYSIVRFFQGPFYFMNEPDLFNKVKNNQINVPNFIFDYFHDSYVLLLELSKNFTASNLDKLFFQELILMSKNKGNLYKFITTLPTYIAIEKPGIQFSTVHSAKGLEADNVFFIKEKPILKNLFISHDPFYVTKKNVIDKCELENLRYVACTRAKKNFYYLEVT